MLSDKYPPDPGGVAVSVQRLAQGLAQVGHSVCVIVPDASLPPGQLSHIVAENLTIDRFGASRREDDTRVDWFELVGRRHGEMPFALIVGYYVVGAGFVAVYAGRYLGIPVVVSARGNDLERAVFDAGRGGGVLWALQGADVVTAVSHDLSRKARALAPDARVEVIHNGVDTALFHPACADATLRQQLGIPTDAPIFGFVGEARQKKGLTILLMALSRLAAAAFAEVAPWLLLVGGVRKDDKELVRVFKAQQPQVKVKTLPYMPAEVLPVYYNLFDLLLLPSLRDGLPNALLEGMACERPILATHVGGIPDALRHGENGWLVAPGDVEGLVTAVSYLFAYPDLRAQLGRAARQTVLQQFTPAQELQANLTLYHDLLAARDNR
ncbi:MAG: glycosyltransferase family 4 protein [Ardenticatenaceae bacterium]|nr:glycosyltransferase family 4 protein [Ardenticatenaceae bacterium]